MIKVEIKNLENESISKATFKTLDEANAWFEENKKSEAFGKNGGIYTADKLTQTEIDSAIETIEIPNPYITAGEPTTFTVYRIPDLYLVEIKDITLDILKVKRAERGKARQEFGAEIVAQIYGINEEKSELGLLTLAQIELLLRDPTLMQIERMLFNGSIGTAKFLIQSLDNTYFTSEEKSYIINLINEFLSKEK